MIFILAKNYQDAIEYINENGLIQSREAIYADKPYRIRGYPRGTLFVRLDGWERHPCAQENLREMLVREFVEIEQHGRAIFIPSYGHSDHAIDALSYIAGLADSQPLIKKLCAHNQAKDTAK